MQDKGFIQLRAKVNEKPGIPANISRIGEEQTGVNTFICEYFMAGSALRFSPLLDNTYEDTVGLFWDKPWVINQLYLN